MTKKRVMVLLLLCVLTLWLSGCGKPEWEYRPITDVNDLEGRRVAVNLGWEADYLLDEREDLILVQYDSFADIIMAMEYDKVDAFAVDALTWGLFQANSSGLSRVEPALGYAGYEAYFSDKREELRNEFNDFLKEYHKSEAFEDHMKRLNSFNGMEYTGPEIPLTGTGETLNVATMAEEFPRAFLNAGESIPTGFDLEILKLFANERNYQINFYFTTYEDMLFGLQSGGYDLAIGYLSDVYEDEVINAGLFVSDRIDVTPVYFIEKTQRDIHVDLSEME